MSTTFLPFLYLTQTLQHLVRSPSSQHALRSLHVSSQFRRRTSFRDSATYKTQRSSDPIPFILPDEMKNKSKPAQSDGPKLDTITPSERLAFARAFEEIAARRPPPTDPIEQDIEQGRVSRDEPEASTPSPAHPPRALPRAPSALEKGKGHMNLNIIMADAAENFNKQTRIKGLGNLHPLQALKGSDDPAKGLMRFPPSLRNAAKIALGIYDANEAGSRAEGSRDSQLEVSKSTKAVMRQAAKSKEKGGAEEFEPFGVRADDDLGKTFENERIRRVERLRVEDKMRACDTDVELWHVMEDEVFPLLDRLGISAAQAEGKVGKKKARKLKAAKPELDIGIYGPLYPMLLVTSLRMLDRHFSQPSQLALSVLPRVKELGVASYVLGVSTAFYNHLLDIYWQRYGDVSSVLAHLEEMRHAGLYFDRNTSATINQVSSWLTEMSTGEHGAFLKAVMTMPEYEVALRSRLRHWTKEITRSIAERRNDLGY